MKLINQQEIEKQIGYDDKQDYMHTFYDINYKVACALINHKIINHFSYKTLSEKINISYQKLLKFLNGDYNIQLLDLLRVLEYLNLEIIIEEKNESK